VDAFLSHGQHKQPVRNNDTVNNLGPGALTGSHRILVPDLGFKAADRHPRNKSCVRYCAQRQLKGMPEFGNHQAVPNIPIRTFPCLGRPFDLLAVNAVMQHELISCKVAQGIHDGLRVRQFMALDVSMVI
jgi:hypothetical protein